MFLIMALIISSSHRCRLGAIIENMFSPDQYTNFGPSPKKTLSKTKEYDAAIAIIACKE